MKEKTIIRSVFMPALVLALVMTACAFHLTKSDSYAGSAYKLVTLKENSVKKVGKWYFKEKGNKIYCSKKKKSGYKKFAVHHDSSNAPFDLVTNGKNVIYIYINPNMDRFKLKKYNCSTKKTSNLKTVAKNADCSYIAAVYKNKIYLNKYTNKNDKCYDEVYRYTISNNKLKKVAKGGNIRGKHGAYLFIHGPVYGETRYYAPMYLYKITSTGVKKVKTLAKYGDAESYDTYCFTKHRIYYSCLLNKKGTGGKKIMSIKWNGTGKKTIKRIKGRIVLDKFTSKYCIYQKGVRYYKYTYKTKKTKLLLNYD